MRRRLQSVSSKGLEVQGQTPIPPTADNELLGAYSHAVISAAEAVSPAVVADG